MNNTRPLTRFAPPAILIGLICLLAWRVQYAVDQEVSLLPWLMGRGWVLYRDMIDQHPPLLPALLALLGASDPGLPLHLVIIGLLAVTLELAYALAARLAGRLAGLGAALLTATWGLPFDSLHLWYDGALAPIYLGVGCLAAAHLSSTRVGEIASGRGRGLRTALVIGLLLGLGVLIKQHAAGAVPFVGAGMAFSERGSWQRVGAYAVGVVSPAAVAAALLWFQGAAGEAWYWAVVYNLTGNYPAAAGLPMPASEWGLAAALFLPAVALLLIGGRYAWRDAAGGRLLVARALVAGGLLLAATLPAWPRYGRYHLQAAVPLLAVAAAVAAVQIAAVWHEGGLRGRLVAGAGLLLLSVYAVTGADQSAKALGYVSLSEAPSAPYAATLPGLRACVDAHAPPGTPIFLYGLDAMLYRVLEREPTRPWAPQLPWIMAAGDTQARWWAGMEAARPPVALVSGSGWDSSPGPSMDSGEGRLRYHYRAVGRFAVAVYPGAPPYDVVCLVRSESAGR
ncbi:MAG: hypothetical protein ACR2M0_02525 [Chloroflexia bacterium]